MKRIKYILILALAFTMLFAGNVLADQCYYCGASQYYDTNAGETICSDCKINREILLYIVSSAEYDDFYNKEGEYEYSYIKINKDDIKKAEEKYGKIYKSIPNNQGRRSVLRGKHTG